MFYRFVQEKFDMFDGDIDERDVMDCFDEWYLLYG